MEGAVKEYESSVSLPVNKTLFDRILTKCGPVLEKCSVIYYPNNVRISDNTVQRKCVKFKQNVLKIVMKPNSPVLFLPLTRKFAIEYPEQMPQNIYTTKLLIVRYVLYRDEHTNYSTRVCAEKHSTGVDGGSFHFTAEVEYTETSYKTHKRLYAIEREFVDTLMKLYGEEIRQIDFELLFKSVQPGEVMNVPSRVWSRFSQREAYSKEDKNETATFKFDGYKARIINNGPYILFYDDLHNMKTVQCEWFKFVPKIIFQVEVMQKIVLADEDKTPAKLEYVKFPSLILVDIIGAYVGEVRKWNLFTPEPAEVLQFFASTGLNAAAQPVLVDLDAMGRYKLRAQEEIFKGAEGGWPSHIEAFDGYVITIANRIFKYKIPTLDVRCKKGYLHLDETVDSITGRRFEGLEHNCIYEIAPFKDRQESTFKILRKRIDRDYTSTKKEYEEFKAEIEFFRNRKD